MPNGAQANVVEHGPWEDFGPPEPLNKSKTNDDPFSQFGPPEPLPKDPLVTGKGMSRPAPVAIPKEMLTAPGERRPGEQPNLLSRFSEAVVGSPHPIDQFIQSDLPAMIATPRQYTGNLLREELKAPARLAYSATVHPLDTAEQIMPVNRAIGDVRAKRYGAAIGDLGGGLVNTIGLEKSLESAPQIADRSAAGLNRIGAPSSLPTVRPSIARAMRNPETGALKSGVRTGSRVAGAVGGGLTGLIGGHEYGPIGGAIIGGRYAPDLVDFMTPKLSEEDLTQGRIARGIRNQKIRQAVKTATTPEVVPPEDATGLPTRIATKSEPGGVIVAPEPRGIRAGEKPGSMYSVERSELLDAARRGKPGAIEVLRDLGNPMVIVPRNAGYPGARVGAPYLTPEEIDEALRPRYRSAAD